MNKTLGLAKIAEEESEVIQPEDKQVQTRVTCVSNCKYAQNPEKVCMLESISLNMSMEGEPVFACGQYAPVEEMMEGEEGVAVEAPQSGEAKNQKQLGLAGAKKVN